MHLRLALIIIAAASLSPWKHSLRAQSTTGESFQSGKSFENAIEAIFADANIEIIDFNEWKESRLYAVPNVTLAIRNARYQSIYGHRAKMEFLFLHNDRRYFIEAKRQRVSGSNDAFSHCVRS